MGSAFPLIAIYLYTYLYTKFYLNANSSFEVICQTNGQTDKAATINLISITLNCRNNAIWNILPPSCNIVEYSTLQFEWSSLVSTWTSRCLTRFRSCAGILIKKIKINIKVKAKWNHNRCFWKNKQCFPISSLKHVQTNIK